MLATTPPRSSSSRAKGLPDPFLRDSLALVTNTAEAPMAVILNKLLEATRAREEEILRVRSMNSR